MGETALQAFQAFRSTHIDMIAGSDVLAAMEQQEAEHKAVLRLVTPPDSPTRAAAAAAAYAAHASNTVENQPLLTAPSATPEPATSAQPNATPTAATTISAEAAPPVPAQVPAQTAPAAAATPILASALVEP